jgi:hypothetical protein
MDQISPKGYVVIRVLDAEGREIQREEKPNQICVGTKEAIAKLLSQQSGTDAEYNKLWAIYAGTGTTPPTVNDTALETVVFKKACDQPFSVDTVNGIVEVQMTIESGEGNGNTFTEIGLYSRGDNDVPGSATGQLMYARQIHGAIVKTSSLSIEYTWRFQVTS